GRQTVVLASRSPRPSSSALRLCSLPTSLALRPRSSPSPLSVAPCPALIVRRAFGCDPRSPLVPPIDIAVLAASVARSSRAGKERRAFHDGGALRRTVARGRKRFVRKEGIAED